MPVTESQRHQLYESLKVHLGESNAETFMNLVPPTDWGDLATTSDVARLGQRIDALIGRIDTIDGRIDTIDGRIDTIDGRIDTIDGRIDTIDGRIDGLEGRMATKTDIAEVLQVIAEAKAETLRTFGTWLFASQAAVIASVTFVIAVGR